MRPWLHSVRLRDLQIPRNLLKMLPVALPLLVFGVGFLAGRALLRPIAPGRKGDPEQATRRQSAGRPAAASTLSVANPQWPNSVLEVPAAPSSKSMPDKRLNSSTPLPPAVATPQAGGGAAGASQTAAPAQPATPQVGSPALSSAATPLAAVYPVTHKE